MLPPPVPPPSGGDDLDSGHGAHGPGPLAHVAACEPGSDRVAAVEPYYLGVMLLPASVAALLAACPAAHARVSADHVTLVFRPSAKTLRGVPLGLRGPLTLTGLFRDDRVQVAGVGAMPWLPWTPPPHPHITISVGEDVENREAGAAIAAATLQSPPAPDIPLQGVLGLRLTDGSTLCDCRELDALLSGWPARDVPV